MSVHMVIGTWAELIPEAVLGTCTDEADLKI